MKLGSWILLITSAQSFLLGHLYVGAALLFGFARKPAYEPGLVLTAEWRDWMDQRCRYSITIGRGIIYSPKRRDDPEQVNTLLERHERKHIWQQEDCAFMATLVGGTVAAVTGDWILGLMIWASAIFWLAVNFIIAGIRFHDFSYEGMYRNAEHERSAYAQCDLIRHLGKSWEELREMKS
jgi:hypothetical protein